MSLIMNTLRRHAAAMPERPAVSDGKDAIRYAELVERVATASALLASAGSRVAGLAADNGIDWIVADLAALQAGVTLVPIPPFFSPRQVDHLLGAARVDTLIVDPAMAAGFAGFEPVDGAIGRLSLKRHAGYDDSAGAGRSAVAKITFTSGSTGQPRGVCLPAGLIDTVAAGLADALSDLLIERHLCVIPLATLLENIAGVYVPLMLGSTVHAPSLSTLGLYGSSHIDPLAFRDAVERAGAESLILQPELLRALIAAYREDGEVNRQLKFVAVGGARVADADLVAAAAHGIPAFQGYGLSECASVVALNRPGDVRPGSVGRPLPGVAVSIAADGEILVGNQSMSGYLGEEDGEPGIIHTGDLGHLDEDGYLYVTGRKKNVFITSFGRNVSPEWPEAELAHERAIAQACVFGEAQPVNTAIIVPAGPATSADAIEAAVTRANRRLPDYARVSEWIVADSAFSPANGLLTPTGKPRREAIALRYLVGETAPARTSLVPRRATSSQDPQGTHHDFF
jgi:long-subunit acyl-CoA synthetase (AMP-forming)